MPFVMIKGRGNGLKPLAEGPGIGLELLDSGGHCLLDPVLQHGDLQLLIRKTDQTEELLIEAVGGSELGIQGQDVIQHFIVRRISPEQIGIAFLFVIHLVEALT